MRGGELRWRGCIGPEAEQRDLCRIDHGSAAQRDDQVDIALSRGCGRGQHGGDRGMGRKAGKSDGMTRTKYPLQARGQGRRDRTRGEDRNALVRATFALFDNHLFEWPAIDQLLQQTEAVHSGVCAISSRPMLRVPAGVHGSTIVLAIAVEKPQVGAAELNLNITRVQ